MPAPSRAKVDRAGLDLVHVALSTNVEEFRRETFRCINELIGCDTCVSWGFPVTETWPSTPTRIYERAQ